VSRCLTLGWWVWLCFRNRHNYSPKYSLTTCKRADRNSHNGRAKAWTVFDRSSTWIVGSNPTQSMDISVYSVLVYVAALRRSNPPSKKSYRLSENKKLKWKKAFHERLMLQSGSNKEKERGRGTLISIRQYDALFRIFIRDWFVLKRTSLIRSSYTLIGVSMFSFILLIISQTVGLLGGVTGPS
jgi:hypothetical protein